MSYVTPNEAALFYGVSNDTIRRWALSGKIKFILTDGGHHRYLINQTLQQSTEQLKSKIIYARVSSKKQSADLKRQIQFIQKLYPSYEVISDIGSGINFHKKGLLLLLDRVFKSSVSEIVVYSDDRLARFSSELFQFIFKNFNVKYTVLNEKSIKSDSEELADDLMSIITVFSARYYGKRKYSSRSDISSASDSSSSTKSTKKVKGNKSIKKSVKQVTKKL